MQRAQRAEDNAALNLAVRFGDELGLPVAVFFGLTPSYPGANLRHYQFMLEGLAETQTRLEKRGTPLVMRMVSPEIGVVEAARALKAAVVIGDENPVRIGHEWRQSAARDLTVPFHTVDADVICPTALFPKEEFAARTIRPKIHKVLPQWLVPLPNPKPKHRWKAPPTLPGMVADPLSVLPGLKIDRSVGAVSKWYAGGASRAEAALKRFLNDRLAGYAEQRNRPEVPGTSELSAYLHFGQIGIHAVATSVADAKKADAKLTETADAYLEELIVRRELAINFCLRNPDYDRLSGCPEWALKSLAKHASDKRKYVYTIEQLEAGKTHDELWNAGQLEMNKTGRMHGYLRMYWAKKILEWTASPEEAFEACMGLNDKLFLCGRDPNGWASVAWAIGGRHDRPWAPERPIFGMVRYMSFDSTSRKFDWKGYAKRVAWM
jgi:deoxyribodipyrimidine photo-lyase